MAATAIEYRLFLYQPQAVLRARVTTPVPIGTAGQIYYDTVTSGSYTAVQPEMLLTLGSAAGGDDLGRARVRYKGATSSIIYTGWASRSRGEGELYVVDNAYLTVWDLYKPWTKNPFIDSVGTTFTDSDRDYATYGKMAPVILLGCGPATQRGVSSVTNEASFAFSATLSYVTDATATAFVSWAWALPAGATVIAGGITQNNVTFTIAEGAYWITVTATDDNGGVATRHVLCVAGEPAGTISQFSDVQINRAQDGQTLRVRVSEAIPDSTYPNGTLALLWKRQTSNGAAVTPSGLSGQEHIVFAGWHHTDDTDAGANETGFISSTSLEFLDAGKWLQKLPAYPITIQDDYSPSTWQEMSDANIDRFAHHILAEYSNILVLADFQWSTLGALYYPFPTLNSSGSTLYEQVDKRAFAIGCKFTCDQWNRLAIKPHPQLLDDTGGTNTPITRTTTVQKALTEAEWSDVRYQWQYFPRANWVRGNAIQAQATPAENLTSVGTFFCVAPGEAPSQGTSQQTISEQLAVTQIEYNARVGHYYASQINNPLPQMDITLAGSDDFAIQPAYMTWVTFTNSAATAGERGHIFTAKRFLPLEVTIRHNAQAGTQDITVSAEMEVVGLPATTVVQTVGNYGNSWTDPNTYYPPVYDLSGLNGSDFLYLNDGIMDLAAWGDDGYLYLASSFSRIAANGGPVWSRVPLAVTGKPLEFCVDAFSSKYLGTGTTVNGWLVTTYGIYYIANLASASRTVTLQKQFTVNTTEEKRSIDFNFAAFGKGVVVTHYQGSGTYVTYTTDGVNWSAEAAINTNKETNGHFDHRPGLYHSTHAPGTVYTSAFSTGGSGAAAVGDVYKSSDYGATWALEAGYQCQDGLADGLHYPFADNGSDLIAYYGKKTITGTFEQIQGFYRRNADGTHTDISPTVGARKYGKPEQRWGIATCPTNRQKLVLCGRDDTDDGNVHRAVFASANAGGTWSTIVADTTGDQYTRCAIAGDNGDILYLFGLAGMIGYSSDFGTTIDDRRGNLSTMDPAPGAFVGICGV